MNRVVLADGRVAVVKRHSQASAVLAEVAGLRWLGSLAATVLDHSDDQLVVEFVEPGAPTTRAAEEFGRNLARLHASGAPAFGSPPPGGPVDAWIGLAPMRNVVGTDWPSWYASHRLEPYLRTAPVDGVAEVCSRIDEFAGPPEPPARLHGDLWNGNVLWTSGRTRLIDPAAHGGHRETDLAMLALFGCPHLDRIIAAYEETAPLAPGWRSRVPLHQLFPLLVHTVLFGGGYGRRAAQAARAVLGR